MGKHSKSFEELAREVGGVNNHRDNTVLGEVKHNHSVGMGCDASGCKADRYVDGRHQFTDGVFDTEEKGTVFTPRDNTLGEVIDRRVQVYGDPVIGFAEIAQMWSTYLGIEVMAYQVPIMMMLMKVVRSKTSPDYSDHIDDIKGYADIFEKVMGEDLIHARSVNEFIELKWPKA